jgi:hypothetical protein
MLAQSTVAFTVPKTQGHYFGGDENNIGYTAGSWTFLASTGRSRNVSA